MIRRASAAAFVALAIALPGCGGGGHDMAATSTPSPTCEGSARLCGRRLDQVVFPATHNSYAASEEPGWYFAPQRFGIGRQLDDGIRALLLDVHYGVRRNDGLVRTDLAAEGSDANKVRQVLPPRAIRVAERLAGPLGVGLPQASPQLYLCHTLCELGADPLGRELRTIASFLEAHPQTFLVLVVEDYVPARAVAGAFRAAGLARLAATLPRQGPLPTLGRLSSEDKRLAVFSEQRGGSPSWYMPAFSYIQDTPLDARRPRQLSCARFRGEPDSPFLLINHWIPPFPPSPRLNAAIGRAPFLRRRVRSCTGKRGLEGAIVAVDFYERTAVVAVARKLNEGR